MDERLVLFVVVMTITPGPNNLMLMASGLNHGIRRSLPHFVGICTGFPLLILAVGLGFQAVLTAFPGVFWGIKVAGAGFLLYLAARLAGFSIKTRSGGNRQPKDDTPARPMRYWQAVLFQWINPKAWTMAIATLAMFAPQGESVWPTVTQIAGSYMLWGSPCVALWLFFGKGMRRFLQNAGNIKRFNVVMACLLVASVVPLLLETGAF